jgi:hypothetical protein
LALNIALLYISLHNQLKKCVGLDRTISRKEVYTILGKHFLIPKNVRICVIKELELMNMIKKLDKNTIQVLDYNLDIERDVSKFYDTLNLFDITE